MTLRKKILSTTGIAIVTLILLLWVLSWLIVLRSFITIEKAFLYQDMKRVLAALFNEVSALDAVTFNWAAWDDTYRFINDTNEEYIRSNLVDETFYNLKLNRMVFVDSSGTVIFEKAIELEKSETVITQDFQPYLGQYPQLVSHADPQSRLAGIVVLPEGAMIVASRPILTSEEKGPIRGTLIMGRYLTPAEIARLAGLTHASIAMHPWNVPTRSPDLQKVRNQFSEPDAIVVSPLSTHHIAGYTLVQDIYGQPGLILKIEISRDIYAQGRASVLYSLGLFMLFALILGGVILYFQENMVFSRLNCLDKEIQEIRTRHALSMRVSATGQDELAGLAQEINRMLANLERSQNTVLKNEERYRTLVENAPLGILSIDVQGNVVDINPMLVAMFGSPAKEARQAINIFTTPTMVDSGIAEDFRACLESGAPNISERWYITQWDKQLYLRYHLTPVRDREQTIIGVQAIIEDNTERLLVEKALKESEAEYRSLFKNMHSGLAYQRILVDKDQQPIDYVFLDVNEAFEELTGLKNVIGRRASEVFPEFHETKPDILTIYGNVALTGAEVTFTSYFEPFGLWFSISAYSPERGYFVTVFDDVTERKWAEESLHKLNEELEQRVEARTLELQKTNQFLQESLEALEQAQKQLIESEKMAALGGLVAGVAHETSTPLGIGVTAASHLEQQTREIESQYHKQDLTRSDLEDYLKTTREATIIILENLKRAADNMKSFKQTAVDQTHDTKRLFNLKQCIENVLLSLRPKLKTTQHTVTVQCPDDLELDSYPGAFAQIITNFVMNSLIHGFEHRAQGHITLRIRQDNRKLQLIYSDNGKGMSDQERSQIFEPFYTTKRDQGGSGLGLHIVYNLVTQTLEGDITCTSAPDSGTTFLLTLPIGS